MASKILTSSAALLALARVSTALLMHNGVAATPAMGWDNWNAYGCDVSEQLVLGTARQMANIGLRDCGYHYVILDDCWSDGRYPNETLRPDFKKFPHGMKYIADEVHKLGLKWGMYSSAGNYTCAQYAGSLWHEEADANTFASWGVDYLKYDNCYNEGKTGNDLITYDRYNRMSMALNATGRQMVYGMCEWGIDGPWNWAALIANSWRISGDVFDTFDQPNVNCPCHDEQVLDCKFTGYYCSIMNVLNKAAFVLQRSQAGAFNDLDMLEIGNVNLPPPFFFNPWSLGPLFTKLISSAPSPYPI